MMFQDNMFLPKKGESPKLIFGKGLESNSNNISIICERFNKNREPIFEYILNKGQQLRLYFDDDGDKETDYDSLSPNEFETLYKERHQDNINKLENYFKDINLDISSSSYNGWDMSNDKYNNNF